MKRNITTKHNLDPSRILKALEEWTQPVLSTMGVNGKVVIIGRPDGNVYTQDGVTVARNIAPIDPIDRMIFRTVVDAAHQQVKECGDGTTTTTALVLAMMRSYVSEYENIDDVNMLVDELSTMVDKLSQQIKDSAEVIMEGSVINKEALQHVATISCHNDHELGKVISDLVSLTGPDGDIKVDTSYTGKTFTEYYDGYVAPSGLINNNFINMPHQKACVFTNPVVLIADQVIDNQDEVVKILQAYRKEVRGKYQENPLVIICDDMQGGALNTLIANIPQIRGVTPESIPACVIKAPMSLDRRSELLEDLAKVFGCFIFKKIGGTPVSQIGADQTKSYFGRAQKITADKVKSVFQLKDDAACKAQAEKLRVMKEEVKDEGDRDFLDQRISRLQSGIGVIYVGGESKAEHTRTNHLVEDAVLASIQALRHGVVPGGGKSLWSQVRILLENEKYFSVAESMMISSCSYPLIRMFPDYIDDRINGDQWDVIDGRTDDIVNAWDKGILDPASVPATALVKAFSVVKQLILSENFLIVEEHEY